MPDITMCEGTGCPEKQMCYRHTAIPNPFRQSYFMKPPVVNDKCDHFTPNGREEIVNGLTEEETSQTASVKGIINAQL